MPGLNITNEKFNAIRELLDSKGYIAPAIAIVIVEDKEEFMIRDSDYMLIGIITKKSNNIDHGQ